VRGGLFRFSAEQRSFTETTARRVCFLAVALMLLIPFLIGVKYALPLGLPTTYGTCFVLFAFSLMYWPSSFLINPAVRWAGTVSYSAYFVHFAVLMKIFPAVHWSGISSVDFTIMFAAVTLATLGISSMTYLIIEKPMIRFGNAIIAARQLSVAKEAQARLPQKGPEKFLIPQFPHSRLRVIALGNLAGT
jgi:peptidoglycan/LPS O-acetylase OafA/YrhL